MATIAIQYLSALSDLFLSAVKALPWIAAFFGFRSIWLKWGVRVSGAYTTTSSITCEDPYISTVILENGKDRAVTIFGIYLKIGTNLYVVLEEFNESPLILKGFETVQREYDPIDYYAVNANRLKLRSLLGNDKIRKQLVLSTSFGKHVVRKRINRWNPVHLFFANHLTGIVRTMRSTYDGKAYGGNAIFLVQFKFSDKTEQVIPIYPTDYEIRKFTDFQLTADSLKSKELLESYLNQKVSEGLIKASSVTVHDLNASREKWMANRVVKTFEATPTGFFTYHVLGRFYTWWSNRKMRRANQESAKRNSSDPKTEGAKRGTD